ncbi:AAA family ATPase [Pantoea agglomerans]|uniref:AAA family ATPase n=1 Tax=Enterobacter agglomerans TaxID=549 RepID=UPI001AA088A0|nr:AAA family ATPase [Pantoea agglomerans]QTC51914.1 AAA family ATPase [Pantoea agglomerans]
MFYIFSGLPGCGKSTIAKMLSEKLKAVYLRVDTVEQALRNSSAAFRDIGPEGYFILYELARDNLRLGSTVITDSVNDLNLVRDSFRDIALSSGVPFLEIEILCSDPEQHRARVENRISDIPGLKVPDWQAVVDRVYEPWSREHLKLDTAELSPAECVDIILQTSI